MKKTMLTGLKPTGNLTLGNYIGSIKQMVDNQDKYESYLFVADMHAITVPNDREELHKNIRDFIALYLACGIDPEKNIIYLQSDIEYIPSISWLLECNTYYGELSRMIQFKEKSKKHANFSAGLLTYPVLMASDILVVDADYVPVGIDQKQHVELTRDIASRFNKKYGETFVIPEPVITTVGTKIMDLVDPTKKMSKTEENPKGVIGLLDDINVARKKIMSATTDSEMCVKFDMENKPGISNLINIYSSLSGESISDIEEKFVNSNYGEFKRCVADRVCEFLTGVQERYKNIIESGKLQEVLDDGANKVRKIANKKYEDMRIKIGLYR
ncbi:MAG: tryptophan--tRNA ligase [Bacilli bacterium]|nr:tryptophan--tRNA ligase [Bacilli bacterium]